MTYKDYLLNAALHYSFKKKVDPQINRAHCLFGYTVSVYARITDEGNSTSCVTRIAGNPEKADFVFDQYFYAAFGFMPFDDSYPVLPEIKQHCAFMLAPSAFS